LFQQRGILLKASNYGTNWPADKLANLKDAPCNLKRKEGVRILERTTKNLMSRMKDCRPEPKYAADKKGFVLEEA